MAAPPSEAAEAAPDVIAEAELRQLFDYWQARRVGDRLPRRAAIDPIEMGGRLLPYVMLVELLESGTRFFYRLVGTDVAFGVDPTGTVLNDAVPEGGYRKHIVELYCLGAASRNGLYARFGYGTRPLGPHTPTAVSRLFLPIEERDGQPAMMLVGQMWSGPSYRNASLWQVTPERITREALFRLTGAA
ncbi:PAS domain-containing protein [Tistlia consotensis]|uniref:PAS domain-containing protein n=1 Tax=Tistlia consotensis USBA 355 TaxID=560819 RepID=A0A1Y6B438_9PROT|nr:PAS domain-containing protein [Tistlia consotensis]SME88965.1 PAS domain-containing protein [Tistlia consotensis USBA 355]SNR25538.1 PAS domain-containing protein [Tistlia consotensis]